jgi:hypothetical protein
LIWPGLLETAGGLVGSGYDMGFGRDLNGAVSADVLDADGLVWVLDPQRLAERAEWLDKMSLLPGAHVEPGTLSAARDDPREWIGRLR